MAEKDTPNTDGSENSEDVQDLSPEQLEEMQIMLDKLSDAAEDHSSDIFSSFLTSETDERSLDDELKALLEQDSTEDSIHRELLKPDNTIVSPEKPAAVKRAGIFSKLSSALFKTAASLLPRAKKRTAEPEEISSSASLISPLSIDGSADAAMESWTAEISEDTGKKTKKERKALSYTLNKLPARALMIVIGVLTLFILGSGIFLLVTYRGMRGAEAGQPKGLGGITVEQGPNEYNNSNYIYINAAKTYLGSEVVLTKIGLDKSAATFYLSGYYDPDDFSFTLKDQNNKFYAPDLIFPALYTAKDNRTAIRFEPIDEASSALTLSIIENATLESVDFELYFQNTVSLPKVKILSGPIDLIKDKSYYCRLEYGMFSSSGTTVHISAGSDDPNESLLFGASGANGAIALYESVRPIIRVGSQPRLYAYPDNNMMVGRMDFAALRSLGSKLDLQINNLYLSKRIGEEIPAVDIYHGIAPPSSKTYEFDDRRVVIQGMMLQGTIMVLVAHAVDKTLPVSENDIYANRMQILLDAELTVRFEDGTVRTFKGDSQSIVRGCDTRFDLKEYKSEIGSLPISSYSVTLNSVSFPLPQVTYSFDLSKASDALNVEYYGLSASLKASFLTRLQQKSALIGENGITGFDSSILQNEELSMLYTPVDLSEEPRMSVQILTMSIDGDTAYAIVCEHWIDGEFSEPSFYRIHKVKAVKKGSVWTIIEDNIIE